MTEFSSFSAPKGVPDYVPPDSAQFVAVRDGLLAAARQAGYSHIELPIFEDTALFARGVGESTDVVSKEMYTFADRGDRSVTLRPEGTAGVVRAVIEHGLDRGALPVKLCYAGPFFRYERPQAGRYRQLQQVGVEAIGVDDPALDAEVIAIADAGFRSLGLDGFRLEITSLGDESCRPQYRELLQEFLFGLDLDEDTRRRAGINPLRVLDDKRPELRAMTASRRCCWIICLMSPSSISTPCSPIWTRLECPMSSTRAWCAAWTTTPRPPSSSSMTGLVRNRGSAAGGATTA